MADKLFECVPNVSEGRNLSVVEVIANGLVETGVNFLDYSADIDHNRSVFTMTGTEQTIKNAVRKMMALAIDLVDMRTHEGVHPCVGALDVLPIVPLGDAKLSDAMQLSRELGEMLWREFAVPSVVYDYAEHRNRLANFRKNGFSGLRDGIYDFGDKKHSTAGATAISARGFLIAWNVNLLGGDLAFAKKIAKRLRESSGGLAGVKALGIYLPRQDIVQVSMNLTDYRQTSMRVVYDKICEMISGTDIVPQSEVIGLIPEDALTNDDIEVLGLQGVKRLSMTGELV